MPTPTPPVQDFEATSDEIALASHILSRPECHAGSLNGSAALDIMGRSSLDMRILRDIWTIADEDRSGDLAMEELTKALRLIGWAQAGEKVHRDLLQTVGPLAHLNGIVVPSAQPEQPHRQPSPPGPVPGPSNSSSRRPPPPRRAVPSTPTPTPKPNQQPQRTASPSPAVQQPSPPLPSPTSQHPPVEPDNARRYYETFLQAEPRHGVIDGDSALDVYMAFSVPYSAIHAVRKLVTRSERNELQFGEFALGMYLLEALQSRQITAVPTVIPQHILDQLSDPALTEDQSPPPLPPPPPPRDRDREIPQGQRDTPQHQHHERSLSASRSNSRRPSTAPNPVSPSPKVPPRPPSSHRLSRVVETQLPSSPPQLLPKHNHVHPLNSSASSSSQPPAASTQSGALTSARPITPPSINRYGHVDESNLKAATSVPEDYQEDVEADNEIEWDVLPHEKLEYDRQFLKLDLERTGFIDSETFAKFMVHYNVPSFELAQICELADMEHDSRIDNDEFSVAMHLVKKRLAGEAIPRKLPMSLVPPSMRKMMRRRANTAPSDSSSPATPTSPIASRRSFKASANKPKPPPKPDIHRRSMSHTQMSGQSVANMATAIAALSAGPGMRYPRSGSSSGSSSASPSASPQINHRMSVVGYIPHPVSISASTSSEDIVESPFEDPEPDSHHLSPSHAPLVNRSSRPLTPSVSTMGLNGQHQYQHQHQHQHQHLNQLQIPHSAPVGPPSESPYGLVTPTASTASTSTINKEDMMDEFKRETSHLTEQVQSLLSQVVAQNELRTANDELKSQNEHLQRQVREMERTVSEVLAANERNQHLAEEVARLAGEVAAKEALVETTEGMLAVVTQEDEQRRAAYKELELTMLKTRAESEANRDLAENRKVEIEELKTRLADMGKALANEGDPSMSNNRQLRVLFSDVSRENEGLKTKVRDMERAMEQLLLTSKSHAKQDELERENRRLKQNVQELEIIATQLQSAHRSVGGKSIETLAKENDQLQKDLKEMKRIFAEYRSLSEGKVQELRQKVEDLSSENARLKVDIHHAASNRPHEDPSAPPPAYDDNFVPS